MGALRRREDTFRVYDEDPLGPPDQLRPHFPHVEMWVTEHLSPIIQRRLGGRLTWCPRWWAHAEAISRLIALWRAWEKARLEGPVAMSDWWLNHLDPHLRILLSATEGPFADCGPDGHVDLAPLPSEPAPDGHWQGSPSFGEEFRVPADWAEDPQIAYQTVVERIGIAAELCTELIGREVGRPDPNSATLTSWAESADRLVKEAAELRPHDNRRIRRLRTECDALIAELREHL
jgi:Domain of unknown function (DUF4913)